jgi:glutathione-specific gamma-glutamylcyclotransferase
MVLRWLLSISVKLQLMQASSSFNPVDAQWVFAYGSLIWNPEFDFEESSLARVHGYHRRFCVRSTLYRGTPENPGVVLGLDSGGSVDGLAFKLKPATRQQALEKLYAREMINNIYHDRLVKTRLRDGRVVMALAFVANRQHEAYIHLNEQELLERLSGCCGARGPNIDYAINTHDSLERLGVRDARLSKLVSRLYQAQNQHSSIKRTATVSA